MNKFKFNYFSKFWLSVILFFLFKLPVLAQNVLPPGKPITLSALDKIMFNLSLFIIRTSAILVVIFIIWSGITYMAAGADPNNVSKARKRLLSGIIGGAIIFGVGVIIQTIISVITREFFCTGIHIPIVNICI